MNKKRRTILACIDGASFSDAVADYAAWISDCVDAPVKLLHNIEHNNMPETNLSGSLGLGEREDLLKELTELEARRSKIHKEQGRLMLNAASRRIASGTGRDPEQLQRHGSLTDTLIDMEDEIRVLVIGVRGEAHEREEDAIGAQLEPIIRTIHRPVFVINREFDKAPERLMIAYDGSEASRKGLDMVTMSPLYQHLECHLVQVGDNSEGDQAILKEGMNTLSKAGLKVKGSNLTGDIEEALLAYQVDQDIDLVVMGAFGHSRLRELLFGSMTLKMLSHAKVPLLLLR